MAQQLCTGQVCAGPGGGGEDWSGCQHTHPGDILAVMKQGHYADEVKHMNLVPYFKRTAAVLPCRLLYFSAASITAESAPVQAPRSYCTSRVLMNKTDPTTAKACAHAVKEMGIINLLLTDVPAAISTTSG